MSAAVEPSASGHLDVGDGQLIYWELVGEGLPLVWLHGGPGGPATERTRNNFSGGRVQAVIFDQRGCGRSTPSAGEAATDLSKNTTTELVADMERLREMLGIERWMVVGGSWGVTLGLAYAQRHPDRVLGMVLAAVTAGRLRETQWITRDMGRIFPAEWHHFVALLPDDQRNGISLRPMRGCLPPTWQRCGKRRPAAGANGKTPTCHWRPTTSRFSAPSRSTGN